MASFHARCRPAAPAELADERIDPEAAPPVDARFADAGRLMRRTLTGLPAILALLVLLVVAAVLFVAFAYVLAVVAPLAALAHLGVRGRLARAFWHAQGRLPGASGVRIVGVERTRRLAVAEVVTGLSGLAFSAVPAL